MKKLCIAIALALIMSLCGCSQRRITKTYLTAVTEETTIVAPKIISLKSPAAESTASDGRTCKHLASVIRVNAMEGRATTLLVNLYDEHGRITNTTSGDISYDYEYDKDSRLIKESKYYNGLYQGYCLHEYVGNSHNITAYSADGSIIYDGETYSEFVNNNGQPSGKIVYINEKESYTSMVKDYDRKTGWIVTDCIQSPDKVEKELKHRYNVNDRGGLVETVTDELSGKKVSETTYLGEERSDDKILRYEEYDSEGNTIRGFENQYAELNGINVLESKAVMEVNPATGKLKADMYFYSTSQLNIVDDIYETIGMEPDDFSSLTVHTVNSGYDDVVISYSSSGIRTKTVTSKKDDSGRVVEVRVMDKGAWVSTRSFEYDSFGNCTKMIVEEGEDITEYIFGYITVPNFNCEPFSCTQAEEYIGK